MSLLYSPERESIVKDVPPAFMIAGIRSGCGKTTLMLSLLAALQRRGLKIQAFKAGPDFIDPLHHYAITKSASYNLDTWMGEYGLVEKIFSRIAAKINAEKKSDASTLDQIIMVEGAMGLFDGALSKHNAHEALGSSAQLALLLHLPILLVVDAKGLAQSVAAIVQGFLSYEPELEFLGIVCTHVGSKKHALMLSRALSQFDIPLLGLLPRKDAPSLPSRHLGLIMPKELNLKINDLADYMEKHFDLDQLIDILQDYNLDFNTKSFDILSLEQINIQLKNIKLDKAQADNRQAGNVQHTQLADILQNDRQAGEMNNSQLNNALQDDSLFSMPAHSLGNMPRIAIAKDDAFCFLYPDFHHVLSELKAELVYFSPLHDQKIPNDCQALYFPGGYPELYAHTLSSNITMLNSIRNFALNGGTLYGEGGGYMYLMREIIDQGISYKMCQCLPCSCQTQNIKDALGYRSVTPYNDAFWGKSVNEIRGHEFHYAKIIHKENINPLWKVKDAAEDMLGYEGMQLGRIGGSWIHLYPESASKLFAGFIQGLSPLPRESI